MRMRVRPYYLYQCDPVRGAEHFRTPISKGIEIIEGLRGHTSGLAIPTYVVDAPGGGGKIPVQPQYLLRYDEQKGRAVLRNFQDKIYEYLEPGYLRDEIRPPAPRPQETDEPAAEPVAEVEVKPPVVGKSRWVRKGATARREKK
jgi:lysine 2,3-aminomutase